MALLSVVKLTATPLRARTNASSALARSTWARVTSILGRVPTSKKPRARSKTLNIPPHRFLVDLDQTPCKEIVIVGRLHIQDDILPGRRQVELRRILVVACRLNVPLPTERIEHILAEPGGEILSVHRGITDTAGLMLPVVGFTPPATFDVWRA